MPKKILLVDDSNTVLMMERMILSGSQYVLSTARNGKEGYERARAETPDLILLDMMMPEMNGLDALSAIRADDVTHAIPVIMVTTRSEADSMEAGFARGCNDYVTKPVNSSELLAKIRNLLGGVTVATDKPKNGYVTRVRDNTRGYIEELLRENAQLRTGAERTRAEHDDLRRQLDGLRGDLARHEAQTSRLLELLGAAEAETRRNEDRFGEVEQQNANLAMLYTASYQLHATVRRAEVLLAIQEIVINLVGSEELAVLGVDGAALQPLVNVGVDPAVLGALRADDGTIGRALASGVTEVPADGVDPRGLTACIPLRINDRAIGVIAIFRLLPQKQGLGTFDRELFELIAAHASTALYCAELHERGNS